MSSDLIKTELRRAVYRKSPYLLGKEVLGFNRFCETQRYWSAWFTDRYNAVNPNRQMSLVLQPRETFKSTFFVVTVAIWYLVNNPNATILICGESQTNAEAHLKEIKSKIESDIFRSVFGDLVNASEWRSDAISIKTRTKWSKEANIEAAGIGKNLTGKHYDIVIADDLVGHLDRDSEAKRNETFNFFIGLFDILKKEAGQFIAIGTRWHLDDLYGHIIDVLAPDMERKGAGRFHVLNTPAASEYPFTDSTAFHFPRLLPRVRLEELQTVKQGKDGMDISSFMAQYMLNPLSPNENIFKTFHYCDIQGMEFDHCVMWTDPALSDKGTACYSATVALGRVKDKAQWVCIYASVLKREPSQLIKDHNRIYRMLRTMYGCSVDAFMEQNGFQLLLKNSAIEESEKDGEPVPTIGRQNTENKEARIRAMEPYVSQGFIQFRADWQTAPEGYRILMEQLRAFPQGKVDAPDALQGAHKQTLSRFL